MNDERLFQEQMERQEVKLGLDRRKSNNDSQEENVKLEI